MQSFVLALVLALSATGAWADPYSDCSQDEPYEHRIRGCTQILERGKKEARQNRAYAYITRGNAYNEKGEVDLAIADYD